MIVKRSTKGSPLTHAELDNNFTEVENSLSTKANSTDVFTKTESNTNFASKSGSGLQTFEVATATIPSHAVPKSQLDAREKINRYNLFAVTGTANDITLTLQADRAGVTAIESGVEVNFVAAFDNTGPVVVTVDFLTETFVGIPVSKIGAVPLEVGDIVQGAAYKLIYDGAGFQLFSGTGPSTGPVDLSNYYTKAEVDTEMSKNRIPVGVVLAYPVLSIPVGYLKCNGQYLLIADYPALYTAIGHTYDDAFNPDSLLYFRVPELRGEFIRGADDGRWIDSSPVLGKLTNGSSVVTMFNSNGNGYGIGVRISGNGIPAGTTIIGIDTVAGTVTMSATATLTTSSQVQLIITGRLIGTSQEDTIEGHEHQLSVVSTTTGGVGTVAIDRRDTGGTPATMASNNKAVSSGVPETRGRNVAMCYCIKVFDTVALPEEINWEAFVTTKTNEIINAYFDDTTADLIKIGNKLIITGTYTGPASGATTTAVINFGSIGSMNAGYRVFLTRITRPATTFSVGDAPEIINKLAESFTIKSSVNITNDWTYEFMVIGSGTPYEVT